MVYSIRKTKIEVEVNGTNPIKRNDHENVANPIKRNDHENIVNPTRENPIAKGDK